MTHGLGIHQKAQCIFFEDDPGHTFSYSHPHPPTTTSSDVPDVSIPLREAVGQVLSLSDFSILAFSAAVVPCAVPPPAAPWGLHIVVGVNY